MYYVCMYVCTYVRMYVFILPASILVYGKRDDDSVI